MSTQLIYPHIEKTDDAPARLQNNARVRVSHLAADYLAYGWSADEMCRQHPHLSPAEVHAAMGYYFDHQAEIDAEIQVELDAFDHARQSEANSQLRMKLRAKGSR